MKTDNNRKSRIKKSVMLRCTAAVLIAAALLCGCSKGKGPITSASQLNDPSCSIGVDTGAASELAAEEAFPEAEILHMDPATGYQSVQQGKLDAYVYDCGQMGIAIKNGVTGVRLLDETIGEDIPIAVGLSPVSGIPDLESKVNAFIEELRENGILDDMYERWIVDDNEQMPNIPEAESPSTHIVIGTSGIVRPYSFYEGTELTGFDIELAKRFGAWLDADIEFKIYDYGAIIAAAKSGDVDCIMANLNVTPERKEAIRFSEPLHVISTGIMVRDAGGASQKKGFITELKESFKKTFIREDRWKLFLAGIGTTLVITLHSVFFGTLLGFALFMGCRLGMRTMNEITRFCVWLVRGMPVVVHLMILYYVIFGGLKLSGSFVAIVGFTIIFGSAVYEILTSETAAIDAGQTEAAYSLGYTVRKAFYKVVLPQAMPLIVPLYKGEMIALLKATAVVGYIAVQDLTKMGDIIRSRTYDAFFPLIAVAIVYFILAALLTHIVDRIEPSLNPKRRKPEDIMKGVE